MEAVGCLKTKCEMFYPCDYHRLKKMCWSISGKGGAWGGGGWVRYEEGLFPHGIMYGLLFESPVVNQTKFHTRGQLRLAHH